MTPPADPLRPGPALRRLGFFETVALTVLRSLDYRGRSTRQEFACWLAVTPLVCASVAGLYRIGDPQDTSGALIALALAAAGLMVAAPGLPLAVRRLHDLGRNAAWLLVAVAAAAAGFLAFVRGLFGRADTLPTAVMLASLAVLAAMLAAGCLLPSQPRANRFGPRPSDEVPA